MGDKNVQHPHRGIYESAIYNGSTVQHHVRGGICHIPTPSRVYHAVAFLGKENLLVPTSSFFASEASPPEI